MKARLWQERKEAAACAAIQGLNPFAFLQRVKNPPKTPQVWGPAEPSGEEIGVFLQAFLAAGAQGTKSGHPRAIIGCHGSPCEALRPQQDWGEMSGPGSVKINLHFF